MNAATMNDELKAMTNLKSQIRNRLPFIVHRSAFIVSSSCLNICRSLGG